MSNKLSLLAIYKSPRQTPHFATLFQLSMDGGFLVLGARDVRAFIFDRYACWI